MEQKSASICKDCFQINKAFPVTQGFVHKVVPTEEYGALTTRRVWNRRKYKDCFRINKAFPVTQRFVHKVVPTEEYGALTTRRVWNRRKYKDCFRINKAFPVNQRFVHKVVPIDFVSTPKFRYDIARKISINWILCMSKLITGTTKSRFL